MRIKKAIQWLEMYANRPVKWDDYSDESKVIREEAERQIVEAFKMAINALKAQEPVEPVVDIDTWKCGICGHTLEHQELLGDNVLFHEQYNYCPECGRAVKWE